MCVIIIGGGDVRPSRKILAECGDANRDGAGVAWTHTNGRVRFVKGLDAKGVAEVLERVVPRGVDYVVHFRLATAGGALPELTHPFVVSDASELLLEGEVDRVLFHNGHEGRFEMLRSEMREKTGRCLDGPVSDSRVAARLAHVVGPDVIEKLSGKYVILGGRGIEAMTPALGMTLQQATGYGAGTGWTMHEGLTFSNMHWRGGGMTYCIGSTHAVSFRGSRPDADTPTRKGRAGRGKSAGRTLRPAEVALRQAQIELGYTVAERNGVTEEDLAYAEAEAARQDAIRWAAYREAISDPYFGQRSLDDVRRGDSEIKKLSKRAIKRLRKATRDVLGKPDDQGEAERVVYTPPKGCARDTSVVPANPDKPRSLRQEK